jgi:hypothetical protein
MYHTNDVIRIAFRPLKKLHTTKIIWYYHVMEKKVNWERR